MRYVVRCVALLVCLAASCSDSQPVRDGIENVAARSALAKEIQRLKEKHPLPFEVRVFVVDAGCAGWLDPLPRAQIIILDKGTVQNDRTLRHEWCHALQYANARSMDEDEARAAEDDHWPEWAKKADGK